MILDEILAILEIHESRNVHMHLVEIQLGHEPMSVLMYDVKKLYCLEVAPTPEKFFTLFGSKITNHNSYDEIHFVFNLPYAKEAYDNYLKINK